MLGCRPLAPNLRFSRPLARMLPRWKPTSAAPTRVVIKRPGRRLCVAPPHTHPRRRRPTTQEGDGRGRVGTAPSPFPDRRAPVCCLFIHDDVTRSRAALLSAAPAGQLPLPWVYASRHKTGNGCTCMSQYRAGDADAAAHKNSKEGLGSWPDLAGPPFVHHPTQATAQSMLSTAHR